MSKDIAPRPAGILETITGGEVNIDRTALAAFSMERVEDGRFARPVPRFLTELPYGGDDDEITDRIAAAILVAADPDKAQESTGTTKAPDLVGKPITVHDIRVNDGDLEGGWGVYLLVDFTEGDSDDHRIMNTGSKDIVVRLARAWAGGELPVSGVICAKPGTGKRGNAALAFIVEQGF